MTAAGRAGRTAPIGARQIARLLALLLLPLHAAASRAQTSPASVNDCTLLPDPAALRRCLDQVEGRLADPVGLPKAQAAPTLESERVSPRKAAEESSPPKHHGGFLDDRAGSWGAAPGRAVIDLR